MRRKAIAALGVVFLLLFLTLTARLAYLMLVQSEELAAQAQSQHSRSLDYYQYARGEIVDRQGRSFTSNLEACLVVMPGMLRDLEETATQLAEILTVEEEVLYGRLSSGKRRMLSPYIFKTGLTAEQGEAIREAEIPGVYLLTLAARHSKNGTAAHILGQLQEGESFNNMRGVSGIEYQYEDYLAERLDTRVVAQVDAAGRLSSDDWYLVEQEAALNQVQLTLDLDYQQIVERAMGEFSGACVVLDPQTGDILAAVSAPGFDAYGWQEPAASDAYVNKVFSFYEPASSFKILLALAAVDSGVSLEGFECEGYALIDETHGLNCWNRTGHGAQGLAEAVANSCNPYFATLGWQLGGQTIRRFWRQCGLEEQTVLGYSAANGSATLDFNANVPGDVANVSIGENGVKLSPLQVAQLTAICANGGFRLTPRLVQQVSDQDGRLLERIDSAVPQRAVTERAAFQVGSMLRLGVTDGTSRLLQDSLLPAAAKTGTSEVGGVWCTGFAPYQEGSATAARWVVTVYVADGSSGGREAATVFKQVVDDLALLEGLVEL